MRVTNEQAEKVICSNLIDCVDCFSFDEKLCCDIVKEEDLATDLLKARETIEKQAELIKEMRGIIRRYVKLDTKCEVQDNLNRNATAILEKTKEYAE